MSSFISLTPDERAIYFLEAEAKDGAFTPIIYEKDFWVCWTLKKLFELPGLNEHLTFKGGTSLSKVYNVIKRFSEDIDVSIHRSYFGFHDEKDPENAKSNNERNKWLEELSKASADLIRTNLFPALQTLFEAELKGEWRIEIDNEDPQTILFYYPTALSIEEASYIKPFVRIEFGARSDNWPQEMGKIVPYIQESFPDEIQNVASSSVRVLTKARTFWEKATILHAEYHRPESSQLPLRHSRHFYDLFCISTQSDASSIVSDRELLERVVQHKKTFFRSGWANYDSAIIGMLRLLPQESQIAALRDDYRSMQTMFFEIPPSFKEVLQVIREIEAQINTSKIS